MTATLTGDLPDSIPVDFCAEDVGSLPFLGKGSTRSTYALSAGMVAKVENSWLCGQNQDEISAWIRATAEGWAELLAPILAWADDCSWLIMARADRIRWAEYQSLGVRRFVRQVQACGVRDLNPGNIGRHHSSGQLVCIDYSY